MFVNTTRGIQESFYGSGDDVIAGSGFGLVQTGGRALGKLRVLTFGEGADFFLQGSRQFINATGIVQPFFQRGLQQVGIDAGKVGNILDRQNLLGVGDRSVEKVAGSRDIKGGQTLQTAAGGTDQGQQGVRAERLGCCQLFKALITHGSCLLCLDSGKSWFFDAAPR